MVNDTSYVNAKNEPSHKYETALSSSLFDISLLIFTHFQFQKALVIRPIKPQMPKINIIGRNTKARPITVIATVPTIKNAIAPKINPTNLPVNLINHHESLKTRDINNITNKILKIIIRSPPVSLSFV